VCDDIIRYGCHLQYAIKIIAWIAIQSEEKLLHKSKDWELRFPVLMIAAMLNSLLVNVKKNCSPERENISDYVPIWEFEGGRRSAWL
jgi:hypothetical protein